jgi:very-short-patch-repair endonuclease
MPVTAKGRTFLDLGAVLPFEVVRELVHTSLITKLVQPAELLAVLERVGRRGRNGTGVLRAIMTEELPDDRLKSVLEAALLRLIRRSAAPNPELQHRLELPDGSIAVLDFAWPDRKIAVEADGLRWHGTRAQMERDNARSRRIQRLGWSHHRYGWGPVHEQPLAVTTELTALVTGSVSRSPLPPR